MATHFTPAALKFLRDLKRNNDRDWFQPRKEIFERELKTPMLTLISEITHAMEDFAPDHVRPPQKILFRIYRDTRFSNDKRPYKEHIGAWWVRTGLEKTSGAGFYFHLSGKELLIAAGCYMPQPEQLLAVRRYLLDHHAEMRKLYTAKPLVKLFPHDEATSLTRPPKGFPADHPAIDLIRNKQWGRSVTLPVDTALTPAIGKEIVKRFKAIAPLVTLINTPLLPQKRKPLFGL
ncbi:DUF2461 domain-containing protein [Terriglobus albidus]|uniref:DUF2461 domain-containing protein n=1 Tax=Terriglobus albidus TaxID=1592106 RepID=A0A5B9E3Y8_9BACT|nr:DUF2461 domain-containing protein [Terriglobus albidus]QEE26972.1 DUF2461 domain-containing protein [Terriglobus albidus]